MKDPRHEPDQPREQEKLVQDILKRTSGSACNRALEQLPLLVAAELGDVDRSLVQSHLEHCAGCRSVAVVLGWLDGELPAMAQLDPGPAFTQAVLARTANLAWPGVAADQPTGAAGLMDRLGSWWAQRIMRPIFAWQVAYAVTVLLVGLTALPPLRGVPNRALKTVLAGSQSIPVVNQVLQGAGQGIDARTDLAARAVRQEINDGWNGMSRDLKERLSSTAADRRAFSGNLDAAWNDVGGGNPGNAGVHLMEAGRAFGFMWRHWWRLEIQQVDQPSERRPS